MNLIDKRSRQLQSIFQTLQQTPLTALRQMLTDQVILRACNEVRHFFRRRKYGPVITVLHFLLKAVQREESFAATWQELWTSALAESNHVKHSVNSSAICQARSRLPMPVFDKLLKQFLGTGSQTFSDWHGFRLLALDCSTVSMPRQAQLFAHFGAHKARTTIVRYPLATCCTLLSVGCSSILDYRLRPFDPGELNTADPLLNQLGSGDLLLADRRYAGSPTMARLARQNCNFLMRKNARLIVENLPVVKRLGKNDFLTDIPMSKPARKVDPSLPKSVRVRIFRVRMSLPGGKHINDWFVTSLTDAKQFSPRKLACLYHLRWQIETSFLEFKVWFGADILRSKTVDNIYKEFAAHVLAYQLVRRLMAQAAKRHNKKPTEISFLNAARWVVSFSTRMSVMPVVRLPEMYDRLLEAIAWTEIDVRPHRLEPRAITREKKHYGRLKIPRQQWKKNFLKENQKCLS